MKIKLLHIELLKYIQKKSNYFGFIEIRPFLLENFPEEPNLRERKKMKDFLKFLSSEEYIEVRDKRGIWIIQEAGVKIARKDISAIVKIKPKGVNLVEQNQLNKFSKGGVILSSIFGLSTLLLGIYSINITQSVSELETIIDNINKENTILESTNKSIKFQVDQLKKEIA
ncbi:hypothetical protein [Pareuzebyella sediminis]|uniref:hypothetical protein n=1 Tax=Pareuzebyella sediminis TaxID=2607998 RepID=UPI0011ED92B5|nr:hypothetical protein [Pareuzebyella sediminis]